MATVLLVLLTADLLPAPRNQWTARAMLGAIDVYQTRLSPSLASAGVACRFQPSCSRYAEGAIRSRGALGGAWRTAWRLVRCGPWTPAGTVDPPPESPSGSSAEEPPEMLD